MISPYKKPGKPGVAYKPKLTWRMKVTDKFNKLDHNNIMAFTIPIALGTVLVIMIVAILLGKSGKELVEAYKGPPPEPPKVVVQPTAPPCISHIFKEKCSHPDHVIRILKVKDEYKTLPDTQVICECKPSPDTEAPPSAVDAGKD